VTRTLGLDIGDKTLGVAVSDELSLTAQGVEVHQRTSASKDADYIKDLVERYAVDVIVVGLPKNMDGSLGPQAQKTMAFAEQLRKACSLPVIEWDERLTTRQAERLLLEADASRRRRKQVRDKLAAQLILQAYLDWRGRHPT